ncbi:MAG: hypothetical protein BroJett033_4210 [Chloroflexota bacterium]|nr:MAG: hypothetical protein BroJett033_4210 [Chloroflexota bacterium]
MDHVVYVDTQADELARLLDGSKRMILRGAAGRKLPHGRVNVGDRLYFINNNGEGAIKAVGSVTQVINSEKLSEAESVALVEQHQQALQLTDKQFKRWAGKRYLVLIEVGGVEAITPVDIDKSSYANMDDWLPVGDIRSVYAEKA